MDRTSWSPEAQDAHREAVDRRYFYLWERARRMTDAELASAYWSYLRWRDAWSAKIMGDMLEQRVRYDVKYDAGWRPPVVMMWQCAHCHGWRRPEYPAVVKEGRRMCRVCAELLGG